MDRLIQFSTLCDDLFSKLTSNLQIILTTISALPEDVHHHLGEEIDDLCRFIQQEFLSLYSRPPKIGFNFETPISHKPFMTHLFGYFSSILTSSQSTLQSYLDSTGASRSLQSIMNSTHHNKGGPKNQIFQNKSTNFKNQNDKNGPKISDDIIISRITSAIMHYILNQSISNSLCRSYINFNNNAHHNININRLSQYSTNFHISRLHHFLSLPNRYYQPNNSQTLLYGYFYQQLRHQPALTTSLLIPQTFTTQLQLLITQGKFDSVDNIPGLGHVYGETTEYRDVIKLFPSQYGQFIYRMYHTMIKTAGNDTNVLANQHHHSTNVNNTQINLLQTIFVKMMDKYQLNLQNEKNQQKQHINQHYDSPILQIGQSTSPVQRSAQSIEIELGNYRTGGGGGGGGYVQFWQNQQLQKQILNRKKVFNNFNSRKNFNDTQVDHSIDTLLSILVNNVHRIITNDRNIGNGA
jgi:hypothetical protein